MTNAEKCKEYRNTQRGRANILKYGYKRQDKLFNRGECTLTTEQIIDLWKDGCYWCGETDWHKLGADRVDNSKPHTIDNVVCSCWSCNAKGGGGLNKKSVVQYTKDGEFIAEYESIAEASRQTGVNNISKACINSSTAGGYIWKFRFQK